MKKLLIAANWKSNKTKREAKNWLEQVAIADLPKNLEIIILPPFTLLDYASSYVKMNSLPFRLGAQDVSPFESGPYTGEISAAQIKEFADYVLIGHSERRTNFSEDNGMVNRKIEQAVSAGLVPIVCVSSLEQVSSLGLEELIIAYEPISAIGTGNAEDPNNVLLLIKQIIEIKNAEVLYGGSVDADNVRKYLGLENISGALVGGQSLDSANFINILKNAT